MKLVKIALLSATLLAGNAAHAQVVLPSADLHGIGATSIQNILPQEMNCLSQHNDSGVNNGTSYPVAEGAYNGTPTLDCSTQNVQPNVQGHYVGTGSGGGRNAWENFNRGNKLPTGSNPFDLAGTDPTWAHMQFTFSDGPISQSDLNTYVATAATQAAAGNNIGNPIQIPLYVLPVALAYAPVYGHNAATGADYKFNVKSTYLNANGGMRLSRANYCAIFNGQITNWNNAALKTTNGNQSLMDPADSRGAAGWASEGVPIRLVGRSEASGTTDIFSRHLAAVCGADVDAGGTNKFQQHAQSLPFDGSKNLSNVDSKTNYTTWSAGNFANSTNDAAHNSISGAVFIGGAINTTDGAEAPGLFMVANGTPAVRDAINLAPDHVSSVDANVSLNGKFGYVGADFVLPFPGAALASAALQQGTSTTYLMANAKNAALAFGTSTSAILPPQSAANGAYNTADARTVINPTTGAAEAVDRANPLHWTAVLYADPANTLAAPVKGYPMTGTTMMLTYTCFANSANRLAVADLVGLITGKAAKQAIAINAGVFSSTSATLPGITAQSGVAPLPAAWNAAISETFLKNSTQISGSNTLGKIVVAYDNTKKSYYTTAGTGGTGLGIESAIPTSATTLAKVTANGMCTSGQGA